MPTRATHQEIGQRNILGFLAILFSYAFSISEGLNCTEFDQAILLAISMLAFVRNRATNILPLILGLFFKISGTSSRVVLMLSNAGVCVSGRTIERLKIRITEDAIQLAVSLITSGQVFFIIFDNINIFLRKARQRISNTNDMINTTNSAVVAIDGVEAFTEADLAEQLALRG